MSDQLRLDIPLLLPEVADTADRCVARLMSELEGREGVDKVHVVRSSDASPPQLCIHYRPDILPLERVRQLARSAGAELTGQYQHLFWDDLEGVGHARRARTIGLKPERYCRIWASPGNRLPSPRLSRHKLDMCMVTMVMIMAPITPTDPTISMAIRGRTIMIMVMTMAGYSANAPS